MRIQSFSTTVLTFACWAFPFASAAERPACPLWQNSVLYNTGDRILYNSQGYEAARSVPLNTPPNPADNGWFWGTTTACSDAPANLTYSANPASYTAGSVITPNTPALTGTVTHYAINPALPAGLALDSITGVISGTPASATAAANYTLTASNSVGNTTAILSITVSPGISAPSNLRYSPESTVYTVGTAISPNTPVVTGTVTRYSVNTPLPAGLQFDTVTGVISGTPTQTKALATYGVSASNSAGSATATVKIAVAPAFTPPSGLTYALSEVDCTERVAIVPIAPVVTGIVTRFAVFPALPAGLLLDSASGVLSGTPAAAASAADYVVTASNPAGSVSFTLKISVKLVAPADLVYPANPAAYPVGKDITPNVPSVKGSVTLYTVVPALPPGLSLDEASGMIWGNPSSDTPPTDYTVSASNSAGTTPVVLRISTGAAVAIFHPGHTGLFALRLPGGSALWLRVPETGGGGQPRLDILNLHGQIVWSRALPRDALRDGLFWDGSTRGGMAAGGIFLARLRGPQTVLEQKRIALVR